MPSFKFKITNTNIRISQYLIMIISDKIKFRTDERVLVECDFKISPKCKGQYLKLYKNILRTRSYTNGKDRCISCFNTSTKTGKDNFNHKYDKNENYFENIDTELKAYMLGFIAGDGCVKKDGLNLENHIKDIEVLQLFKTHISPDTPFHKHHDPVRGANTICLKIHSRKMVKDLLKWLKLDTYGKKSDKIQLPDLPDNLLWAFVRGLFDSDGSIRNPNGNKTTPVATICSTSIKMQHDLINLCDKVYIKYIYNPKYPSVTFSGKYCLLFLNKIYENANYFLSRKYDFWKIWTTWIPNMGTSIKPRKVREYYPPISEEHKKKISEANRKKKRNKI